MRKIKVFECRMCLVSPLGICWKEGICQETANKEEKSSIMRRLKFFCIIYQTTNFTSNSTESAFCCKLKFMPRGGRCCFKFFANRQMLLSVLLRNLSRSVSSMSCVINSLSPSCTVLSIWSSSGSKLMLQNEISQLKIHTVGNLTTHLHKSWIFCITSNILSRSFVFSIDEIFLTTTDHHGSSQGSITRAIFIDLFYSIYK